MPVTTNPSSIASLLNAPLTGALATYLQQIAFGSILRQQVATTKRRQVPLVGAANPYVLSTIDSIQLPDDAKACTVLRATVIAGGTTGELSAQAYATTPATTQVAVAPSGDIVFNHSTDAVTSVDVTYIPERQDAYELPNGVPASAVLAIPAALLTLGVVSVMEAEILTGTVTGKCVILKPGAAPGTTLQANLNVAKTQVLFKVSDAPTAVRVKFGLVAKVDPDAMLESQGQI